ncbi:MAG: helix-turn-helix domain-containing protein [Ilumatobacteraceae bacterium]
MTSKTSDSSVEASADAHRRTVLESDMSIVGFLVELLGSRLTAHLTDVDVSTVSRWKAGNSKPHPEAERRLRDAHQVARMLLTVDSDQVVRSWFIGMNPQLDDDAPLEVIAAGNTKAVIGAARSFILGA